MISLDSTRAKQIMNSQATIEVLYMNSPVWIENVMENNLAQVTYLDNNKKDEVPIYKLVENTPAKK
jgi:H-type small acid-soluble spore protein